MKNLWILYCSYFVIILQEDVTRLTEGAGVDLELPSEATQQMVCIHINTVNTGGKAAPFCLKFSDQIGDAAYLREHLDTMPYICIN